MFKTQRNQEQSFWNEKKNQKILKQILKCDVIEINEAITLTDLQMGCDAITKTKSRNNHNINYYIAEMVSLRLRNPSPYLDINFRNSLYNPNSELAKILASYDSNSDYSRNFIQMFDVDSNNDANFCIKWKTEDIANYVYQNLDKLPSLYKTSFDSNRYDIPLKDAVQYGGILYDLRQPDRVAKKTTYNFIFNTYR